MAKLVLFGSHARGEATEESDVDILVAIDDLTASGGAHVVQHLRDGQWIWWDL